MKEIHCEHCGLKGIIKNDVTGNRSIHAKCPQCKNTITVNKSTAGPKVARINHEPPSPATSHIKSYHIKGYHLGTISIATPHSQLVINRTTMEHLGLDIKRAIATAIYTP